MLAGWIRKPWFYSAAIIVAGLFLALAAAVFFMSRVSQARAGMCPDTGTVLSEQELRRAVIKNLINNQVEISRLREHINNNGASRVGVIREPREHDVRKLIVSALGSEKTFEENLSIEEIAQTERDAKPVEEPFILVSYETYRYGSAMLTDSNGIEKIEDPQRFQKNMNSACMTSTGGLAIITFGSRILFL